MGRDLKAQLPRTWPAFFAGHGNFTEVQRRALPVLLAGRDALITSATASGKTEAALAPLLERYSAEEKGLHILYLCPTRALARDLYGRLTPPLERLGVSAALKSGDTGPVSAARPPALLVTTPESLDSLLTRTPRVFTTLRALVIDEVHLFDGGVRGDQLRCLLARLEAIRRYAGAAPQQRVALSATVARPAEVAGRYLHPQEAVIVAVEGGRTLQAELEPLPSLADLSAALARRSADKTLVFCNTRHEVEQTAAYLRSNLPFEAEIFVHYGNLDAGLRREVEARFAAASVAVCVSSSTLELGVDIGSIDEVALLGPPPSVSSLLQRIGRGGRRGGATYVLCLFRSPREQLRFDALLRLAHGLGENDDMPYRFKPSVVVQQTFSLLKQSPTGGLRFADLRRVVPEDSGDDDLRDILHHLQTLQYLRTGQPGEWRAGVNLNELADAHEIYSNIGGENLTARIVDAYTGRAIAMAERPRGRGDTLLMGGQSVEVRWQDRYTFGVEKRGEEKADEVMHFRTAPFAVPLSVTLTAARALGLRAGELPYLHELRGALLFHFWGDVYGLWLAALLDAHAAKNDEADAEGEAPNPVNEFCIHLPAQTAALPPWDETLAVQTLHDLTPVVAPYLELGRFHELLPPALAARAVLEHVHLERFAALYQSATLLPAQPELRARLRELVT